MDLMFWVISRKQLRLGHAQSLRLTPHSHKVALDYYGIRFERNHSYSYNHTLLHKSYYAIIKRITVISFSKHSLLSLKCAHVIAGAFSAELVPEM